MSTHAYSEDQLVKQPAIGLFAELGWQTVSALERLHPALPPEAITAAVDELTRIRSAMSLDSRSNLEASICRYAADSSPSPSGRGPG